MSHSIDTSVPVPGAIAPRFWTRLRREPLLHFLVLGALVFAVDYALASREEDPNVITITPGVDKELKEIFRSARTRDPDAAELQSLRQRWLDNEVLYREGLSLRLDQGDSAIRERVIFKAFNVVQANLQLPPIDDAGLRQWFEQNRTKYDEPERIDFLEAVIQGKPTAGEVQTFVAALNSRTKSEVKSGLRVFRGRPRASIVASFGEPFAASLGTLATGEWHMLASNAGPRAIRIENRTKTVPAEFTAVREAVMQDWRDRRMQELRAEAVGELARKYKIVAPEARILSGSVSGAPK